MKTKIEVRNSEGYIVQIITSDEYLIILPLKDRNIIRKESEIIASFPTDLSLVKTKIKNR